MKMRPAVLPFALAWLAVHAALLGFFLVFRFVGLKLLLLAAVAVCVFWFLLGRRPLLLAQPRRLVV